MKVRKKPMIVEAVQWNGIETTQDLITLQKWSNYQVWPKNSEILCVQCLEALAETPKGSYVVKGVKGEVWPVREDIFNETYEIVSEE